MKGIMGSDPKNNSRDYNKEKNGKIKVIIYNGRECKRSVYMYLYMWITTVHLKQT